MSQGRQAAAQLKGDGATGPQSDAARKRAAVEMVARHEAALKRTARRYSLDAEDAEDAYQRSLEIVLTKAPTTDPRELIRWTQTVTKHEALAVKAGRERLLGYRASSARPDDADPIALIPAAADGPDERAERSEATARSREALRALKPAELRALTLLAEGYSYAEIGELTGYSQTKINRLLAEGRNRFRDLIASSEDGRRCRELRPLLSAFCDDETSADEAATVREHLRACSHCRATMRAYRAAPRIAVVLAPVLPPSRSLLERAHDFLAGLGSRLPGSGGAADSTATHLAAAGGAGGAGIAGLAKLLALCGAAVGSAACVATGVLPTPFDLAPGQSGRAAIERPVESATKAPEDDAVHYEPAPTPQSKAEPAKPPKPPAEIKSSGEASAEPAETVEYEAPPPTPEPASAPPPASEGSASTSPSGSAAGEFGP